MKRDLPVCLILFLLLTSCGIANFKTSDVKADDINRLDYFEPLAYIRLIKKGNQAYYSSKLSESAATTMDSIIANKKGIKIAKKIEITDSLTRKKYIAELNYMLDKIIRSKQINNIVLTPAIDSVMRANHSRFSMATIITGFTRERGNYGKQSLKGVGIGVLTLGLFAPIPIKNQVSVYTFIFDSKNKNIAFYRKTLPEERSPIKAKVLAGKLYQIFYRYFL